MNKTPLVTSLIVTLLFGAASLSAQEKAKASPHSVLKQTVGLTEVTVDYHRPSARGREIFGGLVPYGEVWRTGANQSTDITFDKPVIFGGESVEAGTYGLYTIPGKDSWTVILYSDPSLWGAGKYDESKDVVRVKADVVELQPTLESFTIGLNALTKESAVLHFDWVNTRAAVEIKVGEMSKM